MATKNRRVAAYFPHEIDKAFKAYKVKHGFATEDEPTHNDSKALIDILTKFLGVESQSTYSVPLPENLVTIDQIQKLDEKFDSRIGELSTELFGELSTLATKFDRLEERFDNELLGVLKQDVFERSTEVPGQLNLQGINIPSADSEKSFQSPLPVREESISRELLAGLSARKLEERFIGANRRNIAQKKDKPDFASWSSEKDKDGIPWVYRDRKYYPLT